MGWWDRLNWVLPRREQLRRFSTTHDAIDAFKKIYVISGEASGDGIGAKVIRALLRRQTQVRWKFRGIGGPEMCHVGDFTSLFPMQELSVMGLVEVLPHLWRFQRRIHDTLRDIEEFDPDVILTIDSKGFTFRVLQALHVNEQKIKGKRMIKVHYVAPSIWAYKHRNARDVFELQQLLDAMFTILPFEKHLFKLQSRHPAVEDFLEANEVFETDMSIPLESMQCRDIIKERDALLDYSTYDLSDLKARGKVFHELMARGHQSSTQARIRKGFGIPLNAFVICALAGSRSNEVNKSLPHILKGIEVFKLNNTQKQQQEIYVVFPTIATMEEQIKTCIQASGLSCKSQILTNLPAHQRLDLFRSCDVAIAVSGTIVLETTLATLPTIVIYRANWFTEWIGKQVAAVRFVSIPNLLLGKPLLPELLFRDCTVAKIAENIRSFQQQQRSQKETRELALAMSTLTNWRKTAQGRRQFIRASDVVAEHIIKVLDSKKNT